MARWRQAVELGMTDEEIGTLVAIARSRSEAARRVERLVSRTLIATLSFTHGPTSSPRPPDMIRTKETMV